jgi:opacity protein-like surface antigen
MARVESRPSTLGWLAGIAALSLAAPASSLPSGGILAVTGGASFPTHPSGAQDTWSTGYALTGAILWRAAPVLSVGIEVGYYRHALDTESFESTSRMSYPDVSVNGYELWVLPVSAVGELDLVRWAGTKPYLRAGFGVYTLGTTPLEASGPGASALEAQVEASELTQIANDTVFGTLVGLGVHTPLSPGLTLTLDATYHVANTAGESTHFLPVRLGLRF